MATTTTQAEVLQLPMLNKIDANVLEVPDELSAAWLVVYLAFTVTLSLRTSTTTRLGILSKSSFTTLANRQ